MATIKHIFKGESLSMLFAFPAEYDMARIQSHGIWIGGTEFTGVIIGQGIELKLTSLQTDLMSGNQRVSLWIDDTQLGVRKPYVGDIAVGNTNALPDNESTSEVYDVIVNVDISVTAIEAGDLMFNYVKGDKGDPFTYDDFTPEQKAELQQPATDAIASIQEVELAVEQAEGLRQQAEINRQTNTYTAISNAENATDDANDAAILANEKAELANDAALLANEKAGLAATATTQANAARDGANSAAQSATNLVNSYATDLAAKELKANKQNSLAPDGTGTKFPTVDAVNAGLASVSNNLIASYEYNSNTEIYISEIDIASGVFTSVGHSLVDGDIIYPTLNLNVGTIIALAQYPTGLTQRGYYVVSATANTFALSLTAGGEIITYTGAGDLTKYHFEYKSERITLIGINLVNSYRQLRIDYYCKCLYEGSTSHITFNSNDFGIGTQNPIWNLQNTNSGRFTFDIAPACTIGSYVMMELDTTLSTETLPHALFTYYSKTHGANTASANKTATANFSKFTTNHSYAYTCRNVSYIRIGIQGFFANGTKMQIYKL